MITQPRYLYQAIASLIVMVLHIPSTILTVHQHQAAVFKNGHLIIVSTGKGGGEEMHNDLS